MSNEIKKINLEGISRPSFTPSNPHSLSDYYYPYNIKMYIRKNNKNIKAISLSLVMIAPFILLFGCSLVKNIDRYYRNQDKMLCESALISKNKEYINKCQCFYEGGDINCIY